MIKSNCITSAITLLTLLLMVSACQNQNDYQQEERKDDNPKTKKIVIPDGFAVDHLYSPSENEQGSWVAMTFDNKGRMIASDQYGGLFRLELPPIGADSTVKPKIEKLQLPQKDEADTTNQVGMGFAQGLLWAHNSLYVMVNHFPNDAFSKGSGMYRLQDLNGDDQYDSITQLLAINGEGEHGPHSIILGPD